MLRCGASLLACLMPCVALAQASTAVHASYETYAAGLEVAAVQAGFSLAPSSYQMNLQFRTTGLAGFFVGGHQADLVSGAWHGDQAVPFRFLGQGRWHGEDRVADIEYQHGRPIIRQLSPPNLDEREPVPEAMQVNTIDTLSALAELIRTVRDTGRCETKVHTYDGRRAVEIEAHTVGQETLQPSGRSSFTGRTLRCDFAGHLLAGFKFGEDHDREAKPMHGTAWLASVVPGAPALPVRMTFETRWFGDATMYLTAVGPGEDTKIVSGN